MANNIGYEKLRPGSSAVGPTAATVQGGVACAIFYLDPRAESAVRWRSDGTNPSANDGLPVLPGGSFAIAGEANVRRAKFVSETGAVVDLHASYFDRVDVLAIQFSPQGAPATAQTEAAVTGKLDDLAHLLRQIRNATGAMAFNEMGDKVPAGDR